MRSLCTTTIELVGLEPRRLMSSTYTVTNLVSDTASIPAQHHDPNLQNSWGFAMGPFGIRVANNGTGTSHAYDGNGVLNGTLVHIPGGMGASVGAPTGLVLNTVGSFVISHNGHSASARFLMVGEDGAITAYNSHVDKTHAIIGTDSSDEGAIYKGLAVATSGGHPFLYAADFHNKRINVYDGRFHDATLTGHFKDPNLPSGYAPFNVAELNGHLFISFAKTQAGSDDEADGPGLGVVDEFNNNGTFLKRIGAGGTLNAPWGMSIAPSSFGQFAGDLLVGNFGDGRINAFTLSGQFQGQLKKSDGHTVRIPGLWGIEFGNGVNGAATNRLYFAAGPNDEADGLFGFVKLGSSSSRATAAAAAAPAAPAAASAVHAARFSLTPIVRGIDVDALLDGVAN